MPLVEQVLVQKEPVLPVCLPQEPMRLAWLRQV